MKNFRFLTQLPIWLGMVLFLACGKTNPGKPSYALGPWNQKIAPSTGSGELVGEMRAAIRQDPSLSRYLPYVDLSDRNGSLVLAGSVPSEQVRDALKALAAHLVTGDHLVDQLQVSKSGK